MRFFGWFRRRPVEPLPQPKSGYRYTYTGHDEALEARARERREQADRIRKAARLLDTHDRAALRRVK